ncbi:MAG: alpha/beta hydrolase [Tatlockia sp.]|nr:alpha/beta hydrolase [Tatlockia sp.]
MKCYIFLILGFFFLNAYSTENLTNLQPGLSLYSEYYPNLKTKFNGTLIFVNGSGSDLSEWKNNKTFFNCVKNLGSIFLYDRPGLGKSPSYLRFSSKNPLTAKLGYEHLSQLLSEKKIQPPYILVAHSYGALYAGYFALMKPELVKGLLLVDPAPRDFYFSESALNKFKKGMDDARRKQAKIIYKQYGGSEAEIFYQLLGFEASKDSLKRLGSIDNKIPIIIISSSTMEKLHPLIEEWYLSQKQWLNKNKMSKIIRVSSDHFIQLERPAKVCNELSEIVKQVKLL